MARGRAVALGVVVAIASIGITALILLVVVPALSPRAEAPAAAGDQAREVVFDPGKTIQVVVALQRLPRGFQIPANALDNAVGVREWPAAAVPVDAVIVEKGESPAQVVREQVVGRVTRTDIEREQPLLRALLVEDLTQLAAVGSDTAALLPAGKVAVALPIDEVSGVAYGVQPGDSVDLIFSFVVVDVDEEFQTALPNWVFEIQYGTFEDGERTGVSVAPVEGAALGRIDTIPPGELANVVPAEAQRPRLVSQRAVVDAMVLYVGEYPEGGKIVGVNAGGREGSRSRPNVITLGVSPQEAVVITWAINAQVDIALAVRSVRDVPDAATSSVTLQYIFETYNVTVPPRLSYSLEPSLRVSPGMPESRPDD
jgi:Flp pilus assembly protein CpaB